MTIAQLKNAKRSKSKDKIKPEIKEVKFEQTLFFKPKSTKNKVGINDKNNRLKIMTRL